MAIFGWICLVLIVGYINVSVFGLMALGLGFSGSVGKECIPLVLIALGLDFLVFYLTPFSLVLK